MSKLKRSKTMNEFSEVQFIQKVGFKLQTKEHGKERKLLVCLEGVRCKSMCPYTDSIRYNTFILFLKYYHFSSIGVYLFAPSKNENSD